jgi:dihydrofolate reductase
MVITIIPILVGGGSPLFSELPEELDFECTESKVYLNKIVQNHFRRIKESAEQ